ncbi:10454_t:CDS:2 [Entrophospora sp. SA101]|nr:10454_t:CDS:2 [Entrophospora sp. SA101]
MPSMLPKRTERIRIQQKDKQQHGANTKKYDSTTNSAIETIARNAVTELGASYNMSLEKTNEIIEMEEEAVGPLKLSLKNSLGEISNIFGQYNDDQLEEISIPEDESFNEDIVAASSSYNDIDNIDTNTTTFDNTENNIDTNTTTFDNTENNIDTNTTTFDNTENNIGERRRTKRRYREAIKGITKPAIRRLARRGE